MIIQFFLKEEKMFIFLYAQLFSELKVFNTAEEPSPNFTSIPNSDKATSIADIAGRIYKGDAVTPM